VTSGGNPRILENPGHVQLRGPVRQVVTSTVQGESKISSLPLPCATITLLHTHSAGLTSLSPPALLAVRSDYHCATWKIDKQGPPALLQVMQVEKGATGISLR
jgi:TATA box-binding protein-associated factor RNA polymerase I subunit C